MLTDEIRTLLMDIERFDREHRDAAETLERSGYDLRQALWQLRDALNQQAEQGHFADAT